MSRLHRSAGITCATVLSILGLAILSDARTDSLRGKPAVLSDRSERAVHKALTESTPARVKLLLDRGANIEARNAQGATPLITAAGKGNLPLLKLLLARHAHLHATDRDGNTALHEASFTGQVTSVETLLEAGARTSAQNVLGFTPLHQAVRRFWELPGESKKDRLARQAHVVKLLLDRGADPGIKDKNGRTPITLATESSNDILRTAFVKTAPPPAPAASLPPQPVPPPSPPAAEPPPPAVAAPEAPLPTAPSSTLQQPEPSTAQQTAPPSATQPTTHPAEAPRSTAVVEPLPRPAEPPSPEPPQVVSAQPESAVASPEPVIVVPAPQPPAGEAFPPPLEKPTEANALPDTPPPPAKPSAPSQAIQPEPVAPSAPQEPEGQIARIPSPATETVIPESVPSRELPSESRTVSPTETHEARPSTVPEPPPAPTRALQAQVTPSAEASPQPPSPPSALPVPISPAPPPPTLQPSTPTPVRPGEPSRATAMDGRRDENALDEQQSPWLFQSLGFGLGLGWTHNLGPRRVDSVTVVNRIVRIDNERNDLVRFMPEMHVWLDRWDEQRWSWGPFLTIAPGSRVVDAVGFGLMMGYRPHRTDQYSFNLGVGGVLDLDARVLGDGLVANEPLPPRESSARTKQTTAAGLLVLFSVGWDLAAPHRPTQPAQR